VASDIPGFRTVLKDGRQGRLVAPNDAFALAEAIDTLLSNDKLRQAMAAEGRRTAAEYDWAVVSGKIVELYREALAGTA
jgi:phosphatidylinositol alpha-mannosyltransferase